MVFELTEMNNTDVGSCKSIQNVGYYFGRGHLFDVVLNVCEIHQLEAFDSVS